MTTQKNKLVPYLLWAFGIAYVLQLIASWFAAQGNAGVFTLLIAVCMFAPFAAALLSGSDIKTLGWKPQIKKNWKMIVLACALPMALTLIGAALYYIVVPAAFDTTGSYLKLKVGEEAFAQMMAQFEAQGMTLELYALVLAIQAITFGPFVNMLLALGEEVGWRGILYPELKKRYGTLKGRLLGGVIWGAWHWPVMIFGGYEYGFGYWGAPVSGMVLFCIFSVACGIIMDWFYEKTDCIWLPALAHGAVNAAGTVPLALLSGNYAKNLLVGPAPIGIIAGIPMFVMAVLICRKKKQG